MEAVIHGISSYGPPTPSLDRNGGPERSRRHVAQKRPRPAKSCLLCRKKKLKCDRLVPCRQCTMRNVHCTYDHEEEHSPGARITEELNVEGDQRRRKIPTPPPPREVRTYAGVPATVSTGRSSTLERGDRESTRSIGDLQSQINRLERLVSDRQHASSEAPQRSNFFDNHGAGPSTNSGTLSVKGSRSRFHGRNQRRSLLQEVSILTRINPATY